MHSTNLALGLLVYASQQVRRYRLCLTRYPKQPWHLVEALMDLDGKRGTTWLLTTAWPPAK